MKYDVKLSKEFDRLSTDPERWEFVLNHKDEGIILNLDNDSTFIVIKGLEDWYGDFDEYIGWSDGIFNLLEVIGIEAEGV